MYTLNITAKVDHAIAEQWLEWQKNVQIPNTMESSCFTGFRMHRLLGHDESDGLTYVIQFTTPSMEKYNEFVAHFDESLRNASVKKWGDQTLEFRTILKKV